MSKLLVLILLVFTGCGQKPYEGAGWPPELDVYVQSFFVAAQAKSYAINISYVSVLTISLGDSGSLCNVPSARSTGCCAVRPTGERTVILSSSLWDRASDELRTELMFHELGHCLLNKVHNDAVDTNGMPKSIMNSTLFSAAVFVYNKDNYLTELFSK